MTDQSGDPDGLRGGGAGGRAGFRSKPSEERERPRLSSPSPILPCQRGKKPLNPMCRQQSELPQSG